jgi:hypothetical protein
MSAEGSGPEGGSLLLNQPVVIDNGTASIKAGFAGSSKPKVVVGTKVGRPKHMRIMPGGALELDQGSSIFVGPKLDEHRGAFVLEHPMDKGMVTDGGWDAMERLWEVRRVSKRLKLFVIGYSHLEIGNVHRNSTVCLFLHCLARVFETVPERKARGTSCSLDGSAA